MSRAEDRDLAHERDMAMLRREQNAECWGPDEQAEWDEHCEQAEWDEHCEPTDEEEAEYWASQA